MALRKTNHRAWEKTRIRIFKRDKYLCQTCLKRGILTPIDEHTGQIDHITPLSRRGTDADNNLQSLCIPCHEDKTRAENSDKVEYDIDGMPVGGHWWNE